MQSFALKEEDIVEKFIKAGGPGGQNVNKVSTCVYLKHIPTGIEVKCSSERTQGQNRVIARRILSEKLESLFRDKARKERERIEKIRRQKRKRSLGAKLRMLEEKRRRAQKKQLRYKVKEMEY